MFLAICISILIIVAIASIIAMSKIAREQLLIYIPYVIIIVVLFIVCVLH